MTVSSTQRVPTGVMLSLAIVGIGLVGILGLAVVRLVEEDGAPAEPLDLALQLEPTADGLASPVFLTGDGLGGRYVVEQRGTVMSLDEDGTVLAEPYLDLRDRVLHHHERGLLGLAFHPGYAENGRLFVLYSSRRDDGATVISELTADGSTPGTTTERPLLVIPAFSTMHKGGMLAFDGEGMLLAGIGDGSTGNDPGGHGQDPASLLGTLLRLDVDRGYPYATPPDNGFGGVPGARAEIHAIGLRNPWRFSVDAESGHVYIGDVGQAEWEEIDVLAPGAEQPSFGWADMEGRDCFHGRTCDPDAHIAPVIAYPHVDGETGHCGVIGGYSYRGLAGSLPAGTYLYADYCSGVIWAVPVAQLRSGQAVPAAVDQVPPALGRVVSFGEDDAGELYLLTDAGYVLGIREATPAADPAPAAGA